MNYQHFWVEGEEAFREGRLEDAERLLRTALSRCTETDGFFDAVIRVDLGDVAFAQRKLLDALTYYVRAFEYFQEADEWSDLDISRFDQMLSCFYFTGNNHRAEQLAIALSRNSAERIEVARVLCEIAENNTAWDYTYGFAFSEAGMYKSSSHPALEMPVDSCTHCLQLSIRLNPTALAYNLLGSHLQKAGQFAEAVSIYRKLEAEYPKEFDEDSSRRFGWALQGLGLINEAEQWLRKSALDFYPNEWAEVEPLVQFYGQIQRWTDAIVVLENFLLTNQDTSAWQLHARCCEILGSFDEAARSRVHALRLSERLVREAISQDSGNAALNQLSLATILESTGRVEEAEGYSKAALNLFFEASQTDSDFSRWWGHHWLGAYYLGRGELDEAESHYREAMRARPEELELGLGRILVERRLYDEAEDFLLSMWNGRDSEYHYVRRSLGLLYHARGEYWEAKEILPTAAHEDPFDLVLIATLTEICKSSPVQVLETARAWEALAEFYGRYKDKEIEERCRAAARAIQEVDGIEVSIATPRLATWPLLAVDCSAGMVFGNNEDLNRMMLQYGVEPDALEDVNDGSSHRTFEEFVSAGAAWLAPAAWDNAASSRLLRTLWSRGYTWADPQYLFFDDFDVDENYLDETLARAESLKSNFRLRPEFPIFLATPELYIALDSAGLLVRAWVGNEQTGLVVSFDPSNFDLFYRQGDSDAMFAMGAALNWFIDCVTVLDGQHFHRLGSFSTGEVTRETTANNWWTSNSKFAEHIQGVREGTVVRPPAAHRVRGHVRRLSDMTPTDGARDNAPSYIRRNMGPNDTFVRAHSRGGGEGTDRLLARIKAGSSLADYLAMAPRSG